MVTLNEYQQGAWKFAKADNGLERVFGLLEESGEVAGLFKRLYRGDTTEGINKDRLTKELGDCLWYLAGVATDNGITLEDVAVTNLEKLLDRQNRGVLKGEGDNR